MLAQFAETEDAQTANFTAWSCALADDAVDDYSLPVALAERAVELDPDNDFHLKTLGAVLYRAGRFDEALAKLNEADELQGDPNAWQQQLTCLHVVLPSNDSSGAWQR